MSTRKSWTEEEEIYLCDNWGSVSIQTLAKNLNRSKDSIINKKTRLGLGSFLESGEYITWNQFIKAIGINGGTGYMQTSWIKNKGFPVKTKRVNDCSFKVVYLEDFWKWADKNRSFINWSLFEENTLGKEPDWVKPLRKEQYQHSRMIKMTPWTKAEDDYLKMLVKSYKYTWNEISKKLNRTEGAVQRRLCDLQIKERPLKAENHNKWTDEELQILGDCIKSRIPYELMTKK